MGVLQTTLPTRRGGGDCWDSTPCGPLGLGPDGRGLGFLCVLYKYSHVLYYCSVVAQCRERGRECERGGRLWLPGERDTRENCEVSSIVRLSVSV